ncbi:MAG: bifunctional diaminohydroxyphosphoribosylaminopyrimidine deaminase/5-amino-6-(5-phosphoribosylamino)uracil reductase RibD [Cyclobacteriaceae bacterium]
MSRAIEIAKNGLGTASPNPLVGCVLVHNDKILGEGHHHVFGQAHAEVNAIASVEEKKPLKESSLYVTLEPCAHFGKTPPCADLIVKNKIKRVFIGNQDPFSKVNGEGIRRLEQAGIEVHTGILDTECREMNRRFFTYLEEKRPYIILKWAQTADGFIARENFDSKWISNEHSRQLVHKWRSEEDAILVGKNTVKYDNPSLTVRDWNGRNPVRVVVDHTLALDMNFNTFDSSAKTIVLNTIQDQDFFFKYDGSIASLAARLYDQKIQSVIVEGGAKTLADFIESDLWDEARIFTSEKTFKSGINAPTIMGDLKSELNVSGDNLRILRNVR